MSETLQSLEQRIRAALASKPVDPGVGELLAQAKSLCAHGQWVGWITAVTGKPIRTIQALMPKAQTSKAQTSKAQTPKAQTPKAQTPKAQERKAEVRLPHIIPPDPDDPSPDNLSPDNLSGYEESFARMDAVFFSLSKEEQTVQLDCMYLSLCDRLERTSYAERFPIALSLLHYAPNMYRDQLIRMLAVSPDAGSSASPSVAGRELQPSFLD